MYWSGFDGIGQVRPLGGHAETQGFPMVFEGGPRGIQRGRHDPLHTGEGLAQGHTAKSFIFDWGLKGFGVLIRF